ncbi:MAG TPA: hypothetical protein VET66_12225, partial [Steroidobacteraceae bacterium]|nr:hypothetical protein [Steroidobacteraceae bacterium]
PRATIARAAFIAAALAALVTPAARAEDVPALAAAVRAYAGPATKFAYAFTDLNGDRAADAVVLLTDRGYCASEGCALLVLQGTATGFTVISKSTPANQPVKVATDAHQGWRTLLVWVKGGTAPPHLVGLRFAAGHYPAAAGRQPAAGADQAERAKTLFFALGPAP